MRALLLVAWSLGLMAQSVRIGGRVTLSGASSVAPLAPCNPTPTQLSNRTSTGAIALAAAPALPSAGSTYCDPTYGTQVLRVSDNSYLDNSVSVIGAVAFNKDSTRLATIVTGGLLRTYPVNPTALTSSAGTTIYPIVNAVGGAAVNFNSAAFFWSLSSDADAADTILVISGMEVYKLNVTTPPVAGNYQAYKIADLSGMTLTGISQPFLQRCSASYNTSVIGCSIEIGDAGDPNAYARVGYVVFNLLSQSTASPTTNYTIKQKFVNGVDSASISTCQSITRLGSDMVTWTYDYTSPYEQGACAGGGYKFYIDRNGTYIIFSAYTANDGGVTSGQYNSAVIVNMDTSAITFLQAGGHGDPGYGLFIGETTGYGTDPTSMKRWTFSGLTTDPSPTNVANNGVALTSALGYTPGRGYNTNFNSTNNLSVVVLSCAIGGCPSTPAAYVGDVWSVNYTGLQQTQRMARLNHLLASGGYTELQPVMSLDGALVAFVSNYGVVTSPTETNYVFVTRVF